MLVVVGGHSRKVGKSAVVAGLIRALPEGHWTAVKITHHGHGMREPFSLSRNAVPDDSDTGRFLAAGATQSWWLRAAPGTLPGALHGLRKVLDASGNAIVESTSILDHLIPDLFLLVVNPSVDDWKESALRFLDRADALAVVTPHESVSPQWKSLSGRVGQKPRFPVSPPDYTSADLVAFVRKRLTPLPET
jgi:hypothetical protein